MSYTQRFLGVTMPIFALENPGGPLTAWDRDMVVLPMMIHPADARWREELQAYFIARWLTGLDQKGIEENVDLITSSRIQVWRLTTGEEVKKRAVREVIKGTIVGEVLLTIRQQCESNHLGSVGKAVYL